MKQKTRSSLDYYNEVLSKIITKKRTFTNKVVLVRVDFNVPLKQGKITDDSRIRQSLQTINYLLERGATVVCVSHMGRPKGRDESYSLKPVAKKLSALLKEKVVLIEPGTIDTAAASRVYLYENLRFFDGEKKNSRAFAKVLAQGCDYYVNDAFGTAHRQHASNSAILSYLPSYIGFLMQKEITFLKTVLEAPSPLVVIIGFAKIGDKVSILEQLLKNADTVLVGGAVAFTFLQAQGVFVGKSLVDTPSILIAKQFLKKYGSKMILPEDVVVARSLSAKQSKTIPIEKMTSTVAGFDIGPHTVKEFQSYLKDARMVFWNGPTGVFEVKPYDGSTNMLCKTIATQSSKNGLVSIVGGGDTVSAVKKSGKSAKFTHLSTGGGASLAFFEKKPLVAVKNMVLKSNI
ncbi:MAG: phosphoglycerate kinase [Candidatus Woesearchaeota archaeon]